MWQRIGLVALLVGVCPAPGVADNLPPPNSREFCATVQRILASTEIESRNTVFTDMPSYRHSKPLVNPLRTYQVVTYDGSVPIVVSCKVKTAAHLRAAYGASVAGEQFSCATMARRAQAEAVANLLQIGETEAADRAAAFIIEDNEPYTTGQAYLADFQISYRANEGTVHINSFGLFQDYDSWVTRFLPERVRGQQYCHLATVDYLKALATKKIAPGTTITTAVDAPVTPR